MLRDVGIVPSNGESFCLEEKVGPVQIWIEDAERLMIWLRTPPILKAGSKQYTETWNSLIVTSAIIFEIKAGTTQVEANAPGTVIFDNFLATTP